MNWSQVAAQWVDMELAIRARWERLEDGDLRNVHAEKDKLVAAIQDRYGVKAEVALLEIDEWLEKRSPAAEVRPYREGIVFVVAVVAAFTCLGLAPLPWSTWKSVGFGLVIVALMTILFVRRRRLEF